MMARPGCLKHHKALTSGRLTGSTKLTNRKKQITPQKVAYTESDGYSLYSTDSEDQVANIHHGLDRCASLLRDILQNESPGMAGSSQKAVKTTTFRAASRPLLNKMGGAKKRGIKKKTLSANVQKETASELNRKVVSGNEIVAEKDVTPLSTKQAFVVKSIHGPCTQHSPVMHQKLCEHAQFQMPLLNSHTPVKSSDIPDVPLSTIPEEAYQPATAFNGHLPTSTPARSPQQAVNPSVVHPGLSVDTCSQCVSRMGPVVSRGFRTSASLAQTQPSALCSAPPHVAHSGPSNLPSSAILVPSPGREAMSEGIHEEQFNEAELIRCIQTQLALLQARERERELKEAVRNCPDVDPVQSKPPISKEPEITEEYNEGTLSEEDTLEGSDVAPVRDTSCQTSFSTEILKPQKNSLQKRVQKVKTVKYLLTELKALLTDHDSETLGVLDEIDDTTSLLPATIENTNIQAEIALALQPLRSENAQLRRRLRILNQQLREQNRAEKECSLDSNLEVVSLQSLNMTLQSQLNESMRSIELLQDKNEEFIKILENQKEENKRLTRQIHEKEQELLEKKQQRDIDSTKLKIEADEMLTNVKTYQYRLEAAEKENQILGITLRQRDAEVNRLRELTWALQGSMSKLLSDLTGDMVKPRQVSSLSKALLEIHQKQLEPNAYPLSDSIINYLKKLEMVPVLTNMEPFLNEGGMKEPKEVLDLRADEHPAQESQMVVEETVTSRNLPVFQKLDAEAASCLSTLGSHELDETIYIPLSSSPSQKPVTATETKTVIHQNSIPHKLECDSKQPSKAGMLSSTKTGDKFYGSFGQKMTVENKSETLGKIEKLESERLQMQSKERTNGSANVILNNPDRLQPDKHCYAQKGNGQKNPGISAADSSFSTLDWMSGKSEWTISSFSTFTSRDEEDFKNGLAALDANIARLQKTLQNSLKKQGDFENTSIVQNN
ncbi:coiled-coil domain-containing protein 14 isoform X2 [Thamnophis elegans]|uniref:coiled-coil domain-containing protein 14 isoform X2 n=1 Tax=Thamnophis elegans TaxID=35005 RepID=UPI001378D1C8|nr:coiled-coil domain-containing protein 14 isoform X2 [Thamnophis elegans]